MELVKTWTHPTKTRMGLPVKTPRVPRSIHLLGLGPSLNDYMRLWINPDTPDMLYQREEVWVVNRGLMCLQHDLAFVLDHITNEGEQFPIYGTRMWKHDRPIITSDTESGWPAHVHALPFREMQAFYKSKLKNPPRLDWFVNSIPLIFAYIGFIGVEEVFCWGLDYANHRSGIVEDGHPNASYWLRVIEELGVRVVVPKTSTFIDANKRHFFYGYQRDPRPEAAERRMMFRFLTGQEEPAAAPVAVTQENVEEIKTAARKKRAGAKS